MTKNPNERVFQNYIKDLVKLEGGWYSQLHPGMGSDIGVPDLLLATDSVGILPSEIKIGSIGDDNKTIWSRAIRPAQIAWHNRITSHGWLSCILIGVWQNGQFRCFVVDGSDAGNVKNGFVIGVDATEIDLRYFLPELDSWAEKSTRSLEY